MTAVDPSVWDLVADLLERRFGFAAEATAHREGLAARLERRAGALGLGLDAYLRQLSLGNGQSDELVALRGVLTNNETYFFRERQQLTVLTTAIVPRLGPRVARPLRVLSAGCSSGEEVYSIAIALQDLGLGAGREFSVEGCDLNPDRVARARAGLYGEGSVRTLGADERQRFFVDEAGQLRLRERFRAGTRFFEVNLIEPGPFPGAASYDVIFCRNVLIYFSARGFDRTLDALARWLVPGGYLFLGHSESLINRRTDFSPVVVDGSVLYQRVAA